MDTVQDYIIRDMGPLDIHYLMALDIKHSEVPWGTKEWQFIAAYFAEWSISVLVVEDTPVAYVVWEYDTEERLVRVHRFVCPPEKLFMDLLSFEMELEAEELLTNCIEFLVPEYRSKGKNDPYDCSQWLLSKGYRCEEVERSMFIAYGKDHDCFVFRKKVEDDE